MPIETMNPINGHLKDYISECNSQFIYRNPVPLQPTQKALRKACNQLFLRGFDAEDYTNFETSADFIAKWKEGIADRGLFICGNVGTGKTYFAKIFYDLTNFNECRFLTAKEAIDRYKDGMSRRRWYDLCGFGHDKRHKSCLIIDDLGSEQTLVNYGERTELLADLISIRYEMTLANPNMITIITSNFSINEIAEGTASRKGYGHRISSRIIELCETKLFVGRDRREDKSQKILIKA